MTKPIKEDNHIRTAQRIKAYRGNPVKFVRDIFGAEPTEQQIGLLEAAVKPSARVAVKSATSTGKSTALAWLAFYFIICYPKTKVLVTAPTAGQLHRVFRSEAVLWHEEMREPFRSFFEVQSDKIFVIGKKDTQFCHLVTGTAENKESLAGLHARGRVVIMVDEASALPTDIFDTLYGTLSSGVTSFILVSNPVRSEGAFYNLFENQLPNWDLMTFTSYGSPNVDEDWIAETIAYYGEDSDFVKMRINGEFPLMSDAQFISAELVDNARKNHIPENEYHNYPRCLGVDVARFGDDSTVIVDRQGPKLHQCLEYKGLDTVQVAEKVLEIYQRHNYSAVYVDGIGIGSGVVDQLKRFNVPVVDVVVSQRSADVRTYLNLRSQLWGSMRDWLQSADIPLGDSLRSDLVGINYTYNSKLQIVLESKKDMKKRKIPSPDRADALALTFADALYSVARPQHQARKVKSNAGICWA